MTLGYAGLLFAYTWPQDLHHTTHAYVLAATAAFLLRTFVFQLGLGASLAAVASALLRRWSLLVATVPLVVFAAGPGLASHLPRRPLAVAGETLTVMSVNLLASNRLTEPVVAEVAAVAPDVLLLQEYTPSWHAAFQKALADHYPYVHYVTREDSFGLALYSRRPFAGPVELDIPLGSAGTPQARAVLRLSGREVVFYNVHLMPPSRFAWLTEHRREFADLLARLEQERRPVVLGGDFNFTNESFFADRLERLGLVDVQRISGRGRGATWPRRGPLRWLPGIRLDHLFISRELTAAAWTGEGRGSDHRPVVATIGLAAGRVRGD